MREKRQFKVQLNDKLSVILQKPNRLELLSAANFFELFGENGGNVYKYVIGWQGFTEEILMGGAGGSDEVEFNSDLIEEYLKEAPDHVFILFKSLCESIADDNKKTEVLEKN